MDSRNFYSILYGWDVELYESIGVRYCAIFIKNTESLKDNLLVQYKSGEKRRVSGSYLFTDKTLAEKYVNDRRQAAISDIEFRILRLNATKDKIVKKFDEIKWFGFPYDYNNPS